MSTRWEVGGHSEDPTFSEDERRELASVYASMIRTHLPADEREEIDVEIVATGESDIDMEGTIRVDPEMLNQYGVRTKEQAFRLGGSIALHEGYHWLHTLLGAGHAVSQQYPGHQDLAQTIWNLLEDRYIDQIRARDLPGHRQRIEKLHDLVMSSQNVPSVMEPESETDQIAAGFFQLCFAGYVKGWDDRLPENVKGTLTRVQPHVYAYADESEPQKRIDHAHAAIQILLEGFDDAEDQPQSGGDGGDGQLGDGVDDAGDSDDGMSQQDQDALDQIDDLLDQVGDQSDAGIEAEESDGTGDDGEAASSTDAEDEPGGEGDGPADPPEQHSGETESSESNADSDADADGDDSGGVDDERAINGMDLGPMGAQRDDLQPMSGAGSKAEQPNDLDTAADCAEQADAEAGDREIESREPESVEPGDGTDDALGAMYDEFINAVDSERTREGQLQHRRDDALDTDDSAEIRAHAEEAGLIEQAQDAFGEMDSRPEYHRTLAGPKVDRRTAAKFAAGDRSQTKMFLTREISMTGDMAVGFAGDCSISMRSGTATRDMKAAIGAIAEATGLTGDDFAALGYSTDYHDNVRLVTSFGEPFEWQHLDAISPGGNTPTADGILAMTYLLQNTTARRKLLIVGTDGKANTTPNEYDLGSVAAVRASVKAARDHGMIVFGLGYGDMEAADMDESFGEHAYVIGTTETMGDDLLELYGRFAERDR